MQEARHKILAAIQESLRGRRRLLVTFRDCRSVDERCALQIVLNTLFLMEKNGALCLEEGDRLVLSRAKDTGIWPEFSEPVVLIKFTEKFDKEFLRLFLDHLEGMILTVAGF